MPQSSSYFRKYDIIIGGIHADYSNSSTFTSSAPYLQDDLTWCVSWAKEIPRWKNIYYIPQDIQTYAWGAIMYIMTIFCAFFLTTFEEKPLDFFCCVILSVQTLVGFASPFRPKGLLMRFHYGQFLIIPFWLTQIFSAFLITFVPRILYDEQISSFEDITRNHFHFAGEAHVFNHLRTKNVVRFRPSF